MFRDEYILIHVVCTLYSHTYLLPTFKPIYFTCCIYIYIYIYISVTCRSLVQRAPGSEPREPVGTNNPSSTPLHNECAVTCERENKREKRFRESREEPGSAKGVREKKAEWEGARGMERGKGKGEGKRGRGN